MLFSSCSADDDDDDGDDDDDDDDDDDVDDDDVDHAFSSGFFGATCRLKGPAGHMARSFKPLSQAHRERPAVWASAKSALEAGLVLGRWKSLQMADLFSLSG